MDTKADGKSKGAENGGAKGKDGAARTPVASAKVKPVGERLRSVRENLPVRLTQLELVKFGGELAKTSIERERQEDQKRNLNAQMNAKIAEQDSAIARIAAVVSGGEEVRSVEVAQYITGRIVTEYRTDTWEIVRKREAESSELQRALALTSKPSAGKPTPAAGTAGKGPEKAATGAAKGTAAKFSSVKDPVRPDPARPCPTREALAKPATPAFGSGRSGPMKPRITDGQAEKRA